MIHPAIRDLFLNLSRHPAFQELLRRLPSGGNLSLSGLTTTAKAIYSVLLWQMTERPLAIVVDGNKRAEELFEAVETFHTLLIGPRDSASPQLLPSLDVLPMQGMSPHAEICEQRAIGLWRLATQRVPLTVMPLASAMLRVEAADFYRQLALHLRVGDEVPLQDVIGHLESVGYERREPVEMVGEYSVRGGILDVFSPESAKPVRLDMFGDLLESIRRFEVESQRSISKVEDTLLLPLTEYQKSRGLLVELAERLEESGVRARDLPPPAKPFPGWELLVPMVRPRRHSVFSLLDRPLILWDEPAQVLGAADRLWKRLEQTQQSSAYDPAQVFFRWEDLKQQAAGAPANRSGGTRGDRGTAPNPDSQPSLLYPDPAVIGLSRQHAGGHRGGAQPGGSRLARGFFRRIDRRGGARRRYLSTSTACPTSLGSSNPSPPRSISPGAPTWPDRSPPFT